MRGAPYICPGNLTPRPGDLLPYVVKNAGRIPSRKPYAIRPDNLTPRPVDLLPYVMKNTGRVPSRKPYAIRPMSPSY